LVTYGVIIIKKEKNKELGKKVGVFLLLNFSGHPTFFRQS